MKPSNGKRLVLIAAILAALTGGFAAFWHLGGWRLFAPYAGRAFSLYPSFEPGTELLYDGVMVDTRNSISGWLSGSKKRAVPFRRVRIVTVEDPTTGTRLIGILWWSPPATGNVQPPFLHIVRHNRQNRIPQRLANTRGTEGEPRRSRPSGWHSEPPPFIPIFALPLQPLRVRERHNRRTSWVGSRIEWRWRLDRVRPERGRLTAFVTGQIRDLTGSDAGADLEVVIDVDRGLPEEFIIVSALNEGEDKTMFEFTLKTHRRLGEPEKEAAARRLKGLDRAADLMAGGKVEAAKLILKELCEKEKERDWLRGMEKILADVERVQSEQQKKGGE